MKIVLPLCAQGLLAAPREKATNGHVVYKVLQDLASTCPICSVLNHSPPPSLPTRHLGIVTLPLGHTLAQHLASGFTHNPLRGNVYITMLPVGLLIVLRTFSTWKG